MSQRFATALEAGLEWPAEGRVLLLHPRGDADLTAMPQERCVAVQPVLPELQAIHDVETCPVMPKGERFGMAVVFLPRAKDLARALVAQAAAVTDGVIVVDGAKTDGVESLLKEVRRRADVAGVVSKAHGKAFWFEAAPVFADWVEQPRQVDGFQTMPGVFSADAIDPASAMLVAHLPKTPGRRVVDLGAGWGYLSHHILMCDGVEALDLVEADQRALECARLNVTDARARFHWADARDWRPDAAVDAVVTNPPFHTGRAADPALGQGFITAAADMLKPSGRLWLVANRQLPYEAVLADRFTHAEEIGGDARFKILRAERPSRRRR